MAVRIGISVGTERVRVVAARGSRVVLALEAGLDAREALEERLDELLAAPLLPRFPRPHVTLAVGPTAAQVRRLTGLPASDRAPLLAAVVREDSLRFFLGGRSALLTTGVRVVAPGEAWAGAMDEEVVRTVERTCASRGLRLAAAVPAPVALARLLPAGQYLWLDGDTAVEMEISEGLLSSVRRFAAPLDLAPSPLGLEALATLGDDADRFADAYAATRLPPDEPLAFRLAAGAVPTWRLAIAASASLVALGCAVVLPVQRMERSERAAAAELERMAPRRRIVLHTASELDRVSSALKEVSDFAVGRRSPVGMLATLADALPEGTALVAVRVDSGGVNLVALGPRAAAVVNALERIPDVASPEIVGPVTRETAAGRAVERVAVRFRLSSSGAYPGGTQ